MINLGDRVTDVVTKTSGVVIAKTRWITGCERSTFSIGMDKDKGDEILATVDDCRLKVLQRGVLKVKFDEAKPVIQTNTRPRRAGPMKNPARLKDPLYRNDVLGRRAF